MNKPLDGMQRWMVKQNLKYVEADGLKVVVARLRAQGYDLVADAVESAVNAKSS